MVARSGTIVAARLEVIEKGQDQIGRKVFDPQRFDFYGKVAGSKWQKASKCVPVSFNGLLTAPLYVWKILIEELKDAA